LGFGGTHLHKMAVFTLPTNMTALTEIFVTADNFTSGLLGIAIWIIVFFGSLFLTSTYNIRDSLIASSFVLVVISLLLKYLNLLGDFFLWLSIIIFAGSIILSRVKGGDA